VSLMKPSWIVFVGGSSGSGKTTIAMAVAQAHKSVRYVSASGLIREAQGLSSSSTRSAATDGQQAEAFQAIIVERFAQYRAAGGDPILLDGHFVVPTASGFHAISPHIFAALGCEALILVETAAETVFDRLRTRESVGWNGSIGAVHEASNSERLHMEYVARTLQIPAAKIDSAAPRADTRLWQAIEGLRSKG